MFQGIGDAILGLMIVAAFAVPVAIGALIGVALAAFGFTTLGLVMAGIGLCAGVGAALRLWWVA